MKILIQAAGYGTRLQKSLEILNDNSFNRISIDNKGISKALIPIKEIPVVQHLIQKLQNAGLDINDIYIITNQAFCSLFTDWAEKFDFPITNIINDNTACNENRLGSNKDTQFALDQKNIQDDIMILAGDTLFKNLNLNKFIKFAQSSANGAITYYEEFNQDIMVQKGNLIIENETLIDFIEKPSKPLSKFAYPSLCYLKQNVIKQLTTFLNEIPELSNNDAPGFFIQWLTKKGFKLKTFKILGRFDLGTLEDIEKANNEYTI
ncbi:NDP-sugar synthase [bacterium]|jgi:glucose-1-phosphate thymidylyltransferase|nr:NDP-sugar synthase [bacterium]MBT4334959.1 NDP-sugar synthase [bacterium]MBT4495697.1 NDP-sugar synthase [bacterium]MBT4763782.1 NDP-sugar synthase [bacterium]MBT5401152.1 NDP-sugar synthase [bacterium]